MTEQRKKKSLGALSSTVLDCPDPDRLAEFYQLLTGWEVTYRSEAYVFIGDGPVRIGFQRVGGFRPPQWPSDGARAHLDFTVPELAPAVAELLAAGATRPEHQAGGDHWVTLLDPDGHPFCLAVPE